MARRDIRDVTPLGIKAINDNFIDLSYEVFGTASFTKKVEKQVAKNTEDIETFTKTVTNLEGDIASMVLDVDDFTISFTNKGTMNYIKNGNLKNGISGYTQYHTDGGAVNVRLQNNIYTGNENALELVRADASGSLVALTMIEELTIGETYTVGCLMSGHRASNFLQVITEGDTALVATSNTVSNALGGVDLEAWETAKVTFVATDKNMRLRFNCLPYEPIGYLWAKRIRCNQGSELSPYTQNSDESYGMFHTLSKDGYEIKDSTGATLITPNGMANEQNFGSTQNVEDGYPLNMSFEIGESTSVIQSVKLKLRQYNFRTDSKGAASGGGATSGDGGSWSSTVGVFDWTQGLAADTSGVTITSSNLGIVHAHTVSTSKLGHRHSVAVPSHQHSTPAHAHPIEFGILELINDNGTIEVDIDGVRRIGTVNTLTTLDITPWVTTSGVHTISLRSPNKKRIQCDVFIKSYIRR